jgi:hypothetical protein
MNISNAFKLVKGPIGENDLYPVEELKDNNKRKAIENKLNLVNPLKTYDEITAIANYLNISVDNIYIPKNVLMDLYLYFDMSLGLLVSLCDGDLEFLKNFEVKKRIETKEIYFLKTLRKKDYSKYFCIMDERIRVMMINREFRTIPHEQKYDVFVHVYSSIDHGFNMLSKNIFYDVKKFMPKSIKSEIRKLANADGYITIYRGMTEKSTSINIANSWTMSLDVAKFFAKRFNSESPHIYKAKINYKDVFAYINSKNEEEILIFPEKLIAVEKIDIK